MAGSVFKGAVGFKLIVGVGIDLTDPNGEARLYMTKPNGDTVEWVATIEDDINGSISYTTQLNDLDQAGVWRLNSVWDITGSDDILYGNTACLTVRELGDKCV
jgi:hypothetical protein